MAAESRFIQTIRDKCAGRPYDVEFYVNTMDLIIRSVLPPFGRAFAQEKSWGLDPESFANACWTKLEDENLVYKLADISFENDPHLRRYARKVFENLLREMVEELSPGFRTRKKQVERVFKQQCLSMCREMCGCWKLCEFRDKPCAPAGMDRLREAAASLPAPEMKPSRNPEARGPSMKDKEMAHYLTTLLRSVGGMARHEDILSLITRQFNLYSIRIEHLPPDEAESRLKMDIFLSPDHDLMARELFENMTSDMKDVHFYRIVKGMTIQETAKNMGVSAGTVFNREKAYREFLSRYCTGSEDTTPEEMEAVIELLSGYVITIKDSP